MITSILFVVLAAVAQHYGKITVGESMVVILLAIIQLELGSIYRRMKIMEQIKINFKEGP